MYFQGSRFPNNFSEYVFERCRKQLGRYGVSVSCPSPKVDLVAFSCNGGLSSSYRHRFRSEVRYPHLLAPVIEEREQRLACALSRKFSRNR